VWWLKALATGSMAIVLPIFSTTYATRWGGTTVRSRGRLVPGIVVGSISALTGYLLLVEGQDEGAGLALGLGIPALVVLSDRVFRVLR
jgi:hypothetical protein